MNIQITLGTSPELSKHFSDLSAAIASLNKISAAVDAEAAERVASVRGAVERNQAAVIAKPAKKTKAAAEEQETFDLGTEDTAEAEAEITYTQKDVMSAFKTYLAAAGKEGRANAEKLLKKYKVVSVKDIKEENYVDVIDALKELE